MTTADKTVVILTPTFLPIIGGAELGIHEIASRMSEQCHVVVVTPLETLVDNAFAVDGVESDLEVGYEVRRYRNPFMRLPRGPARSLLVSLSIPEFWHLWKLKRAGELDALNVHFARPFGVAIVWARWLLSVRTVLSLIGRTDVWADAGRLNRVQMRVASAAASEVVAITDYCLIGAPYRGKALVVPYGVDLVSYSPARRSQDVRDALGVGTSDFLIFAAQRLAAVKRVDQIIEVAAQMSDLRTMAGGRYVIAIAGRGDQAEELARKVADLDLDNVQFLGFVSEIEMPAYFASADVFVSHSMSETFGVTFAQAMASGLPIVAADTTCISEVVLDGETGVLVEPHDVDGMASAIARIDAEPEWRKRLSDQGRRRALEVFNWDDIAAQMMATLDDSREP